MNNVNYIMYNCTCTHLILHPHQQDPIVWRVPYNQWRRPIIDAAEEGGGAEKLKTWILRLRTNHDPKYNGSFTTCPPHEIGQLHHCMIILFIISAVSTCNLSITLLETDLYYLKRRQHFRQNLYFNLKFNTPLCSIVQGGGEGTNIGWGYEDVP